MKEHTLKIFKSEGRQKGADTPVYVLRDGKIFRTAFHPGGWSELPDYNLGQDGRIYRTHHHPNGPGLMPDYVFREDMKLYRTAAHPKGESVFPEFEVDD